MPTISQSLYYTKMKKKYKINENNMTAIRGKEIRDIAIYDYFGEHKIILIDKREE